MAETNQLSTQNTAALLATLKNRFEQHMHRHPHIQWSEVENAVTKNPEKLWSLQQMEITGGEPDIIEWEAESQHYFFVDCAVESPAHRRSLCYDAKALANRRANKPRNSALTMAETMGITLLTEDQYRILQNYGQFDTKTSSWIMTPTEIRALGGALYCDRRYNRVFTYHNGADSYYAARGFRGVLKV